MTEWMFQFPVIRAASDGERAVLDGVILGTGGRWGFEIESGPQH